MVRIGWGRREDFIGIFNAMDGRPVTIRLPSLAERRQSPDGQWRPGP